METVTNTLFGWAWVIRGEGIWRFNDDNELNTSLERFGAYGNVAFLVLFGLMFMHIGVFTIF